MKITTPGAWLALAATLSLSAACGKSNDDDEAAPPDACQGQSAAAPEPMPYLSLVPAMAPSVRVIDMSGEKTSRQVLARTLQGLMNRTQARVYIVDDIDDPKTPDMSRQASLHWLTIYQQQAGITPGEMGTLDQALAAYAPELSGYLLASEDEPWSLDAAANEAASRSAVVATAGDVAALEGLGLKQLESFVGRWPDAASCYQDESKRVGQSPHKGFAVIHAQKQRPRDFFLQQGIPAIAGYPKAPEWASVKAALSRVPPHTPVYGYTARDGFEELDSVTDISKAGAVLVPSDSTPNLSFHSAVRPSAITPPHAPAPAVDCDQAELNVVIAISDGDNLVLAAVLYPTSNYWLSPDRGRLPLTWSISLALGTIAPTVFDYYTRTLAPSDELIAMIGPGYSYSSQRPDGPWFYSLALEQMKTIGLSSLWVFDPLEQSSGKYSWASQAEAAVGCGRLTGLLDGYYPSLFYKGPSDDVVGKVPILRALGRYEDGPKQIGDRIRALLARPKAERPRVAFYSASAWSNEVSALVSELAPLEAQGVRFLTASAGERCARAAAPE